MSKLVTIFGGSGFVGRYVARRMAKAGWRVRVACRRPNEAMFVKPYGVVGQVEPVLCNVRDDQSVAAVIAGADAVVNCVGILAPSGKNTFDTVQAEGAARIARIASEHNVTRFVHVSAIGASVNSDSAYQKTKALGELAVREHMPDAVILRPSIVFGPEDQFFNRFASMTRMGPMIPVVGGSTKFQPVYVDDVAAAAEKAIVDDVKPGVYELGGPDIRSFQQLMHDMLTVIYRRRIVMNVPFWAGNLMGLGFEAASTLSGGLIPPQITRDQVKNLRKDNVVSDDALGFADLGITPIAMSTILPEYLWRYRPTGQYDDIKNSAKNLRT